MSVDRITWVRIEGFRSIEDLTIHLDGLQVLIGENGAGKSTIIEAFELLRKASATRDFGGTVAREHGGLSELLRVGAARLRLSVGFRLAGDDHEFTYALAMQSSVSSPLPVIVEESLDPFFSRDTESAVFLTSSGAPGRINVRTDKLSPADTGLLALWGADAPEPFARFLALLRGLRVQQPFDTRALWAATTARNGPRVHHALDAGTALDVSGSNLASVFQRLRNEPRKYDWAAVMLDLRAGLGADVRDVLVETLMPGASVLKLDFASLGGVPVSQLSEGQLSYLLLVALAHLDQSSSALVFDEPELHLHPGLLVRATWLFERIAEKRPVILATHADALLDSLDSAERAVRVLELNEQRATVMRRLSHERLEVWRSRFESVGELRREGLLGDVVERTQ